MKMKFFFLKRMKEKKKSPVNVKTFETDGGLKMLAMMLSVNGTF